MDGQDTAGHMPISALERARAVVPMLWAARGRIEQAREVPADVMATMHAARLFRLLLPRSLGGDELDLKTHAEVIRTIAMGDASTAL